MLLLTQQLKGWRHLCPLYHYHPQLLTYSAVKLESENSTNQGNSFGQLAASIQKNNVKNESKIPNEKLSKHYRNFPKYPQGYSDSQKDSSGLSQDSILEKWNQFKDAEYQKTMPRWGSGQQDDAEEDYQDFVSRRTSWVEKDPPQKDIKSTEENVNDISSGRKSVNYAKEVGMFGNLNPCPEEPEGDEGDVREEKYQTSKLQRKHRPHFYAFKMKKLCKERKLSEAIKILEEEMPAAATKPDNFCFQVLINACGRAGYTKKAFQLYNQMKKRDLKVEPVAYTGLFLACAHSPWPTTDGLQRATHLRSLLQEKGYQFNQIVSHAMIKAFGWCGDMGTAFLVVDEMIKDEVLVTTETMNFLLQACITSKEVGFRHAVKVWRKMRELKLQPDIHSYNLLMRVVKDCGAGDPNRTSDLLMEGESDRPNNKEVQRNKHGLTHTELSVKVPLLDSENEKSLRNAPQGSTAHHMENNAAVECVKKDSGQSVLPNILGKRVTAGDVVALGALDKPTDRLALLGGSIGILRQMKRDRVTPNLKTFTQMLESLPSDTQAEQALLQSMKNLSVEPDTQFFNMLIKKRNFRYDTEGAQEVITLMQDYHLFPDFITYGCLALGCRDFPSATQLLKDMDANQYRPNLEIMTMLVKNSLVKHDYVFTMAMLKEMKQRGIPPNDFLLSMLERARTKARDNLMNKHKDSMVKQEKKKRSAEMFLSAYKVWLQDSKVHLPEHPWTQYR